MTYSITLLGVGVVLVALLLTVAVQLLWTGRPWELPDLGLRQRLGVARAVTDYDFWLAVQGVRGGRRRELREELRTNLYDSVRDGSDVAAARRRLGSLRQLAQDAEGGRPGTPWLRGAFFALVALEAAFVVQLLLSTVWFDAASASGADRVEGAVSVVPGMRASWEGGPDGATSFGIESGPAPLVVALVIFVLVSRPWRRTPQQHASRGRAVGADRA